MTPTEVYTVRVSREGKWWMVHVPALDALTQARRLAEVEDMARSLIALTQDVPSESVRLRVEIDAIEDLRVTEQLAQLEADRADAESATARFRQRQLSLVRSLRGKGLTVRDIGSMLGVSFQRVQQMLDDDPHRQRRIA